MVSNAHPVTNMHLLPPEQRRLDWYTEDLSFVTTPTGYDITIVSPHSTGYVHQASKHGSASAKVAESRKEAKYNSACHEIGLHFIPVGLDTYGALRPQARAFQQTVSQHMAARNRTSPADEYRKSLTSIIFKLLHPVAVATNRRKRNFWSSE